MSALRTTSNGQQLADHWDLDHPFERLLVDTAVAPDACAVDWINSRLRPGERWRVVTGIPGKTGVVYTLDRATGKFLWATPTIAQNVITGPGSLERVPPGAPVSCRSLAGSVRRPHLAGAPRERETLEESVEVGIALRHRVDRRAGGQSGQVMLNRANFVQQSERIHRAEHRPQAVLHHCGNRIRREQTRARRLRRVVAFANPGAVTRLFGELERRLENVDEQARRRIQASQRCRGGYALQATIPDQSADDRAVLLLDPRLVVLPIRPASCEIDPMFLAEGDQHLVEKLAAVIDVDPQERKRKCAAKLIDRVDHQLRFTH